MEVREFLLNIHKLNWSLIFAKLGDSLIADLTCFSHIVFNKNGYYNLDKKLLKISFDLYILNYIENSEKISNVIKQLEKNKNVLINSYENYYSITFTLNNIELKELFEIFSSFNITDNKKILSLNFDNFNDNITIKLIYKINQKAILINYSSDKSFASKTEFNKLSFQIEKNHRKYKKTLTDFNIIKISKKDYLINLYGKTQTQLIIRKDNEKEFIILFRDLNSNKSETTSINYEIVGINTIEKIYLNCFNEFMNNILIKGLAESDLYLRKFIYDCYKLYKNWKSIVSKILFIMLI